MRAFVFPGQGSQSVGMGVAIADASAAAREVFQEVDEALGESLSRLMAQGPADELMLTQNAQPAIMANAIATLRMLEKDGGVRLAAKADYVAGHSLGEYSALCAAGSFDLPVTARLLRLRGLAMQAAVPVGEGAMAALLGVDRDRADAIAGAAVDSIMAERGGAPLVCAVANDNDPTQVVISGHRVAIERAVALAKEMGAKRALLLPVSAPFHCSLMIDAAAAMEDALLDADIAAPQVPLFCNVDAVAIAERGAIRVALVAQVTGMVRWRETVLAMAAAGVTQVVEFGGKVLAPMVKRTVPDMEAISVVSPADVEALARAL
ncbi:ACP S-malonyltransferase [Sphingomonas bacterium]|uniref:ACP S-malonyltransferase n=1 Tax=Sphingomonas bacterium TaxID=1895847 RepID=UPI0015767EFF|nr:ACP S-malonyltransferase [Sphingomonas bacterium]